MGRRIQQKEEKDTKDKADDKPRIRRGMGFLDWWKDWPCGKEGHLYYCRYKSYNGSYVGCRLAGTPSFLLLCSLHYICKLKWNFRLKIMGIWLYSSLLAFPTYLLPLPNLCSSHPHRTKNNELFEACLVGSTIQSPLWTFIVVHIFSRSHNHNRALNKNRFHMPLLLVGIKSKRGKEKKRKKLLIQAHNMSPFF